MRAPHPTIPPAPPSTRRTFDPWNSASTGHQRADNRLAGSTSWRQSRTLKLGAQFRAGASGGERIFDMVGAGSKDFGRDGRKENGGWERGASGLRERGWRDVGVMIERGGQEETEVREEEMAKREGRITETQPAIKLRDEEEQAKVQEKRMFSGLTIYLNGSTAPMISDHKLKHLLAEHGARISIRLGRRSVTHVILGKPNGHHGGAGGGLAGSKIQKEIQRVGGKGVKFVGVEWVLESIEAGKRLPEARFAVGEIKPKGVKSVYGMFLKKKEATARTDPEKEGV